MPIITWITKYARGKDVFSGLTDVMESDLKRVVNLTQEMTRGVLEDRNKLMDKLAL